MSNYYLPKAVHTKPAPDFVRWMLPIHIACIYAHLANDLMIGAIMGIGFGILTLIKE